MKGDTLSGDFDESRCFGNDRFGAFGTCVEHVRRIASSNSEDRDNIKLRPMANFGSKCKLFYPL